MRETCALCGLANGNGLEVAVRRYYLRPARGSGMSTGTVIFGRLTLCDRCVVEQARGASGTRHEQAVA